ncbi:MAG: IS200/IS605 family element transposase accessory protein TnpB, partial [bacterium]|nr:IS200/IS605 family element transposase accessory protein TnpB [Candidatus Kapabacteria bacterium]
GAIAFDARILSILTATKEVSIRTIEGRERIAFSAGDHQIDLLKHPTGEADLVYRDTKFYLLVTVTLPDVEIEPETAVLGVDLGIVNIAADSDGTIYSGAKRDERRQFYERRRQGLQRMGTRSARRRLKKLSKSQKNFQRNENHSIAKHIVEAACEGTKRAIALENLSGIRARTTVSRKQRSRHSNWSFFQLRTFIDYKAQMRGIRVVLVDPRNTSRECPCCGHIDKKNRPSRDTFRCRACGYAKHADVVGAMNVSNRGAAVNLPMVSASVAR